ncbi:MAG TPA: chemotaxis protein CheW [Sphingobium sp.]|nr:chemotaxis protein CheW [Sphingobium sp.]
MTDQLFLFANIADTGIAIPTDELEAVVHLGEIIPVARTAPCVRGLAALRSRVLTVIDALARITGELAPLDAAPLAIVAEVEGHNYALLIDDVSDICAVEEGIVPIRGRISKAWAPFARGMVLHDGATHLALSMRDLVSLQPMNAAA